MRHIFIDNYKDGFNIFLLPHNINLYNNKGYE
jgi:hypothetical protein